MVTQDEQYQIIAAEMVKNTELHLEQVAIEQDGLVKQIEELRDKLSGLDDQKAELLVRLQFAKDCQHMMVGGYKPGHQYAWPLDLNDAKPALAQLETKVAAASSNLYKSPDGPFKDTTKDEQQILDLIYAILGASEEPYMEYKAITSVIENEYRLKIAYGRPEGKVNALLRNNPRFMRHHKGHYGIRERVKPLLSVAGKDPPVRRKRAPRVVTVKTAPNEVMMIRNADPDPDSTFRILTRD